MNEPLHRRRIVALAALAVFPLFSIAQEQEAADGSTLEEVVVTTRKVEERLLDVPLAITAFTADQIEARGIRNLDDVAANTPGLTFSNVIGEFLPVPVIRGLAPTAINQENNAAIFVDGVYVSGREGLNFSQLDLERIEVVKGPQAALYGRNSFSGAINYITAKPTDELDLKAEVTLGNRGKRLGQFSVSGSIIEGVLRGRVAVLKDSWDGSYKNSMADSANIGGYEYTTLQGALTFTPGEVFEGTLSFYVSDDQIDESALTAVVMNCEESIEIRPASGMTPATPVTRLLNFCGELPSVDEDSLSVLPQAVGEDRDLARANLSLMWDTAVGTFTSLTGHSALQQSFFVDGSRSGGNAGSTFAYVSAPMFGAPLGPIRTFQTGLIQPGPLDETQEVSQELRFTSPADRTFRWSVGAYYYETDREAATDGVVATMPLPADFRGFCPCVPAGPGNFVAIGVGDAVFLPWFTGGPFGDASSAISFEEETDSIAGFSFGELDFAQAWTARGEVRYTEEDRGVTLVPTATRRDDSWNVINWRASLDFKPQESWTIYGAVASAEKSGGFDSANVRFVLAGGVPGPTVPVVTTFDPEKNLSYELGMKAELLDRRLRTEFDVYYIDWTDIVIPQVLTQVDGQTIVTPTSFDVNAGDATVIGTELALIARLGERWDADFSVSWRDAEYDTASAETFAFFPSVQPNGDISGRQILRQSEWQAAAGLGYEAPIGAALSWFARTNVSYRGKQFADSANQTILPEQTLVNASLGLDGERYALELWGRNLTDEDGPTGAFRDIFFQNVDPAGVSASGSFDAFFPFRWTTSHPRLRTYGVTFRMRF